MLKRNGLVLRLVGSVLLVLALGLFFGLKAFSLTSAGAAPAWPTVKQGSTGENVYSVQLLLEAHGYTLGIDGSFGPKTVATVKSFQSAHHLGVDGAVGPQTWSALIVTTKSGSTGSAVIALQRQLNAHGKSLTTDGNFGPKTKAAVESFQKSKGLTADGVAGPQTWINLVSKTGTPQPPPPTPPSGSTLWGVDTASTVNATLLNRIISTYGKPSFIGKYLNATAFTPLSASEASFIHSRGIHILVIESDAGHDTTSSAGVARAKQALAKAHSLGIPKGTAIFSDLEARSSVDAGWIEGWYNTISAAGYVPGYYGNPYAESSKFDGAYCSAVSHNGNIATRGILFSAEPDTGRTSAAHAPGFAPAHPYCNGHATGRPLVWQYGLAGKSGVNVDTDEIKSSVRLW